MAMKESDKKMISVLGVVAIGYLIYSIIIPMYDEHEKRKLEIDNLVSELKTAHKKAENMSGLVGEVDVLKYRLAELKKVLPTEASSFELIEKMQGLAAQAGVSIKAITIEERKDQGQGWKTEGLRIQFSSYWFQFIDFLWKIENYERLVDVTSISIAGEAMLPGAKLQRFTITITANVYSSTLTEA